MKRDDAEHTNEIVRGCLKGKKDCQEMLFKRHYGKMLAVCYRYASDRDEAKDMLQEGFIKVFDNLNKFNFKGSLEAWMRRIIVNNCIDIYRKKKEVMLSLNTDIDIERFDKSEEIVDDSSYKDLDVNDIIEAVQQLTPAYKMVFNLFVMEGHSHQEIAEMLNISEGTSKSNLAKAKLRLKEILIKKIKTT